MKNLKPSIEYDTLIGSLVHFYALICHYSAHGSLKHSPNVKLSTQRNKLHFIYFCGHACINIYKDPLQLSWHAIAEKILANKPIYNLKSGN